MQHGRYLYVSVLCSCISHRVCFFQMLVKLSFEVFVTDTETVGQNLVELSTKAFTKLHPQIVTSTALVIPIHLCGGEPTSDFLKSRKLKLTVICDEPR